MFSEQCYDWVLALRPTMFQIYKYEYTVVSKVGCHITAPQGNRYQQQRFSKFEAIDMGLCQIPKWILLAIANMRNEGKLLVLAFRRPTELLSK
jgi:hypothetical protein